MAEKQSEIDRIPPPEGLEASKLPRTLSKRSKRYKKTRHEFSGFRTAMTSSPEFSQGKISRETRNELRVIYSVFRGTGYRRVWRPPAISGGSGKSPGGLSNVRWNWFYSERSEFRSFREVERSRWMSSAVTNSKNRTRMTSMNGAKRSTETVSNISTSTTEV